MDHFLFTSDAQGLELMEFAPEAVLIHDKGVSVMTATGYVRLGRGDRVSKPVNGVCTINAPLE